MDEKMNDSVEEAENAVPETPEVAVPEEVTAPTSEEAPAEEAPVEETPVEETPVEETPVEETPAEPATVEAAPVEAPADPTPADPTPADPNAPSKGKKAPKTKKPKVRFPFWKRLLIFLLGLLVGFVCCVGAIAGVGFWAYKNISVQKLQEMGILGDLPEAMQGKGEKDITAYTLGDLLADITYYTGAHKDELTLNNLEKRYGLKLLSDVKEMLPAGVADLKLAQLGEGGIDKILACIDMKFLLSKMPEGTFSDAMLDSLGSRTLDTLTSGEIGDLFSDVKLGYLMGLAYEKQGDAWVLIPEDPDNLTMSELMADIDVGSLLSTALEMDGDILSVLEEDIGDISFGDLMGFEEGSAMGDILLSDAIIMGEDGTYEFSLEASLSDMSLGDLMGYEKEGDLWKDDGKVIDGIEGAVADLNVSDVMNGEIDVMAAIEDIYLGEIMDYTATEWDSDGAPINWVDADGNVIDGMEKAVANMQIASISGGELNVDEIFEDSTVGELQGYVLEDGTWYEKNASGTLVKLDAIHQTVAGWNVADLLNDSLDIDAEVQELTIGDVMGYEKDAAGHWCDSEGHRLTQVLELLADKKVSQLDATIDSWHIGDVMGFTKDGESWKNEDGDTVSNMMMQIANLRLADISDENAVLDAVQHMTIADVMHYEKVGDEWYYNGSLVTGVMAYLADSTVDDLETHVNEMSIADVLGLEKVGGVWVDAEGNPVSNILSAVAEFHVEDLETEMDSLTLSDLFEDTNTGFFKILGGDTKINELDGRLDALFAKNGPDSATIGDFMDAGLISNVSSAQNTKLKALFGNNWKNTSITGFVEKLINAVT